MNKIEKSIEFIREVIGKSRRPAAMLSFGKDSMVLAHLIRIAKASNEFPVDVIYHRDPWFPHKHNFADHVIQSWNMTVHDWPPQVSGVKVKPDMLELVARYGFGINGIDIPKNVCAPSEYPRRDYICGLLDWINRPKSFLMNYPWDTVFIGHRSADVDQFEGPVPLKSDQYKTGAVQLVFPLRNWSDNDLWDYIDSEHIPVQKTRYQNRREVADKWHSNDYTHACTACIDPRETRPQVYCPKLKREVPNRGAEVFQLSTKPEYIEKAA